MYICIYHVNITTDAPDPVVACSHLDDVVPTPRSERSVTLIILYCENTFMYL